VAAAEYLGDHYPTRNALIVGMQAVLDDLPFDPERTDEFEDAMEQRAFQIGSTAQRSKRDTNNGPDVLWSFAQHQNHLRHQPGHVAGCPGASVGNRKSDRRALSTVRDPSGQGPTARLVHEIASQDLVRRRRATRPHFHVARRHPRG
jgi:hypothetical protein